MGPEMMVISLRENQELSSFCAFAGAVPSVNNAVPSNLHVAISVPHIQGPAPLCSSP